MNVQYRKELVAPLDQISLTLSGSGNLTSEHAGRLGAVRAVALGQCLPLAGATAVSMLYQAVEAIAASSSVSQCKAIVDALAGK